MATASIFLLRVPTLNWKNHLLYHSPQFPPRTCFPRIKIRKNLKKRSFKCFLNNSPAEINKTGLWEMEIKLNPVEIVGKTIVNALKALQKPAAAAVFVGLLLLYDPYNLALAASGGRIGGSSFSSSSGSSRSSSGSYSYSGSGGSGLSYSSYSAPSPSASGEVSRDGSIFYIMIAVVALVAIAMFLSEGSEGSVLTATEKTSVLKLQVGLLGSGRSLQKDLNRIAETANTSTQKGLHYVLTETILALLRHPDYCISAYSSVDVKRSMEEGEKRFNKLSIEERGKFDEETLVNVNNIKKQISTSIRAGGFSNEYIVITILVAAGGELKLPTINNSNDLKEALQKLASIPLRRTLAVEVLWTPQVEDDTLSERQLLEDYPLLRPLAGPQIEN